MAMDCGHFEPSKEKQLERLEAGVCPVCNVLTISETLMIPHERCSCCDECWAIKDNKVVNVVHS